MMNTNNKSLDHIKFDPKYNLQMMFEVLVEIVALQQATNRVLNKRLFGEDSELVDHEIFKTCAELKPQIMESLYITFGKTPSVKSKKSKPRSSK